MQQFLADIDDDFSWSVATVAVAMVSASIVLPNRTTLRATREAGLVQIADARSERLMNLERSVRASDERYRDNGLSNYPLGRVL